MAQPGNVLTLSTLEYVLVKVPVVLSLKERECRGKRRSRSLLASMPC